MNDDERRIYNQAKLPNWRFYQELIEYIFNSDGFRAIPSSILTGKIAMLFLVVLMYLV